MLNYSLSDTKLHELRQMYRKIKEKCMADWLTVIYPFYLSEKATIGVVAQEDFMADWKRFKANLGEQDDVYFRYAIHPHSGQMILRSSQYENRKLICDGYK